MTKEIVDFQPGDVFNYQFSNGEVEPFVVVRTLDFETKKFRYNLVSLVDGRLWDATFMHYDILLGVLQGNDYDDKDDFVKTSFNIVDITHSEENPFKQYTDKLAKVLLAKNKDYGDSFSKSLNKFGMVASVVRLEDKFNRLENLATKHKQNVKDESLADTFLDLAGYSILSYKYLKEHEDER